MSDNVEELIKCTNIESASHRKSYIRNIAMALQLGHTVLKIGDTNYIPNDNDIPTIKTLIGEVDSKVLELMNDYLSKAKDCYDNDIPENYGDLTTLRDNACMDVANRVREVIKDIEQAEH